MLEHLRTGVPVIAVPNLTGGRFTPPINVEVGTLGPGRVQARIC